MGEKKVDKRRGIEGGREERRRKRREGWGRKLTRILKCGIEISWYKEH